MFKQFLVIVLHLKEVATVDKINGSQNDFILLPLIFVGHLRDVRRLVVAMSRARMGLYICCRRSLFEQCYELHPTFQLLLQRPDHLALNINEVIITDSNVEDTVPVQLVSDVEEMADIVNYKMHQVYQARVMNHQSNQFSANSEQVSVEMDSTEENGLQNGETSLVHAKELLSADGKSNDSPQLKEASTEEDITV